jgi:hypothetical protein
MGPAVAIQNGPTWFIAAPTGQASRRPGKASADLPAPRLCGAGLCLPHVELAKLIPAKAGVISRYHRFHSNRGPKFPFRLQEFPPRLSPSSLHQGHLQAVGISKFNSLE